MASQSSQPSLKDQADYEEALRLKNLGNEAFKAKDYKKALKNYSRVFIHIGMNAHMDMAAMMMGGGKPPSMAQNQPKKPVDPQTAKTNELRLTAFNNMAMVYLKTKEWQKAAEKCDRVIEKDPKNQKALFRRGVARRNLGSLELARADFTAAEKIEKSAAISRELRLLAKEEKKAENAFYKQMKKQMMRGQKNKKKTQEKVAS